MEFTAHFADCAPQMQRAGDHEESERRTRATLSSWHRLFAHRSDEVVRKGADRLLLTHVERSLVPAHLHAACDAVERSDLPGFGAVWDSIIAVRRRCPLDGDVDIPQLTEQGHWTPVVCELARHLGGWSVISRDGADLNTLRAQARKAYEEITRSQSDLARLPEGLRPEHERLDARVDDVVAKLAEARQMEQGEEEPPAGPDVAAANAAKLKEKLGVMGEWPNG